MHKYESTLCAALVVVVSDGREENKLYQVMTDSETLVGDMPLDGIFVLDTSDTGTEGADLMKQTDTKGADLMKQTGTKGADLTKQTGMEGADLMKQDSYTQLVFSMQDHSVPHSYVLCSAIWACNCTLHCTVNNVSAVLQDFV